MAHPKFEVIEEPDPPQAGEQAGANLLLLALKSLSQRAVAAIADLFFLTTVGSAFWLWVTTPDPNQHQIISLALYALFVLAANWLVRR